MTFLTVSYYFFQNDKTILFDFLQYFIHKKENYGQCIERNMSLKMVLSFRNSAMMNFLKKYSKKLLST